MENVLPTVVDDILFARGITIQPDTSASDYMKQVLTGSPNNTGVKFEMVDETKSEQYYDDCVSAIKVQMAKINSRFAGDGTKAVVCFFGKEPPFLGKDALMASHHIIGGRMQAIKTITSQMHAYQELEVTIMNAALNFIDQRPDKMQELEEKIEQIKNKHNKQ
jgi:hypothetical protein